ncbi:peptide/nickel transport system permease protein [Rhizobium sp. PP-F2F-G38]|nr:peptide/nickel transport system permease protein [Rhizobium sp. PP-WC-1G-195]PYE92723.1 peptide/nickel transport system permease protein [Rhizobium sp. PP-F2F-G38]TCL89653.1 peptide/nickel transport system permease protein [Rhizobium sp. PP-WC-2G-219]TCP77244.1 peptide/nickel transport system permease protein [Rhizobium sp. PP-CC-2G-626]TCQ03332.1 peptide/nickel transport system permease protein [Rhizobium sp. PP-F2F-G36]
MIRYLLSVLRRLTILVVTILLCATLVFWIVRLIPGDPVVIFLGDGSSAKDISDMRHRLGLNDGVATQIFRWYTHILQGDLGQSISKKRPVLQLIGDTFQITAIVVSLAVLVATLTAVPLGIIAARCRGTMVDRSIIALATLQQAIPGFWMGLLAILVFAVWLGWLPAVGYVPFSESPMGYMRSLVLPVLSLATIEAGFLIKIVRASALEVLSADYVTCARSRGLREAHIMRAHVLKNSFAPTWTMLGLIMGSLLGGAAVTETVFTLPGLGRLMVDAVFARDYPLIQGCMLFIAAVYVAVNLLVDLIYPLLDPRVSV